MKRMALCLSVAILVLSLNGRSQTKIDSVTKGKYTLVFMDNTPDLDPVVRQKLIKAFFMVYPAEAKKYNKNTLKRVTFFVDTAYKGVAATGNGKARYNPDWLRKHPEDIDMVTHEVMHIVQDYHHRNPGWLTEGIADYVRYRFGVNNVAGKWSLTNYKEGQSYTNSYRITARFLVWAEQHKNKHLVQTLDAACRDGKYAPELWTTLTGKSLDDLWSEYIQNAQDVKLKYKDKL